MDNKYNDKTIQEALDHLEFPFQEQDWDLMNARLDEENKKTSKLFWFRTIEVAVLLLAVWTLVEFVPFNQDQSNSMVPMIESIQSKENIQTAPTIQQSPIQQNTIKTTPEPNNIITAVSTDEPIAAAQSSRISETTVHNNSIKQAATSADRSLLAPTLKPNPIYTSSKPNIKTITNTSTPELTISSPSSIKTQPTSKEVFKNQAFNSIMGKTSNLAWNTTSLDIDLEDLPAQYNPGDPLPKLKKFRPWNLKLYFSPDMNSKPNNNNIGLAAGGLITKEIANGLHFGGGISYSNKQFNYAPGELGPTLLNPVQLMTIKQHHIEIPLELEYTIKESINWRPYVVGGVSSNFVMYTEYDFQKVGNVEKPSTLTHTYPEDTKGLISGGKFSHNNYYTANIGIGLERQLDNNLHLFIQPTFKYALTGMGPKDEKINTIGLIMGARTTL